jgi:hypothetical protein
MLRETLRDWMARREVDRLDADGVVVRSVLAAASDDDLCDVLTEFFDVEYVVDEVASVGLSRSRLSAALRYQIAESLVFHGKDDSARPFL